MQYFGTLGPGCADVKVLTGMFQAGMTGIRLNLSHGDLSNYSHWLELLFQAADKCNMAPDILIDLRGPELRLGRIEEERAAAEGEIIAFGNGGLPVPEMILSSVEEGDHVLVDDGKLEFLILENQEKRSAAAKVIRGGVIQSGKSMAILGKELPMPTLTESDHENILHAKRHGVTGVMLPFVRSPEDLMVLRAALNDAGAGHIKIFAKIESLRGVQVLPELLPFADHVVIARGDLGNAMPLWELPGTQKRISRICRGAEKPFMVVTQMLDSMHERAVPTRAEVSDIYNAAWDGAAALMLTGETAVGKYPVEAMKYLVNTGEAAIKDMTESGWDLS